MEDDFMRQAREDFTAAGRPWPPFEPRRQPARFGLESLRAWWNFNQGFGWVEYFRSLIPNMAVDRYWRFGGGAYIRYSIYFPRWGVIFYRMTATDGAIAVTAIAWRLSFFARIGFPDPVFAEKKRAEMQAEIDAENTSKVKS